MSGPLDFFSLFYFRLEDSYYSFLDRVQEKIPVYSVVDPVDKIVPSFAVLLGIVFLLGIGLIGSLFLGGVGSGSVLLSVSFQDESGKFLEGVSVSLTPYGFSPVLKETPSSGKISFLVPFGDVLIEATKAGFDDFSEVVWVDQSGSKSLSFTLVSGKLLPSNRILLIQDSLGNIIGLSSPVTIYLAYSCQSGNPPSSQTVLSGTVNVEQPGDCKGLSVNVSAEGYVPKTQPVLGDHTVIVLESKGSGDTVSFDPYSGKVEVVVSDEDGLPVLGADVKLYKVSSSGSKILSFQKMSDSGGFVLFETVSPGEYGIQAGKPGFVQSESVVFQLDSGSTEKVSLILSASSLDRKLWVKVLSSKNQLPVSNAQVGLFVQSVYGAYLEYGTFVSDSNGMVDQPLTEFNGSTMLLVRHSDFVYRIIPNAGIVSGGASGAFPVLLDPIVLNNDGSLDNAVIVEVQALDVFGLPVENASVSLFSPDANGVLLDTLLSNSSGLAVFSNLPEGSFQATASTSAADGISRKVSGELGEIVSLPVVLDLGNALVEVTVSDDGDLPVKDANVSIVNRSSGKIQGFSLSDEDGLARVTVDTGQTVFVLVEKKGYLPFVSVPFEIIKDNTHRISISVSLTSETQNVDIVLNSVYAVSSSGRELAQSIVPDSNYSFYFTVKSPTLQNNWLAMLRSNDEFRNASLSDVGNIVDGVSAIGSISLYDTYNPFDEFSPFHPVSSGDKADVLINSLGDVDKGGSFELVSMVYVSKNAVPFEDILPVHFQSKSDLELSPLYLENFEIGSPITFQGDFAFTFFVSELDGSNKVQVSSINPVSIEQNKDYVLDFVVTNLSGRRYSNSSVSFVSNTPSTFSVVPQSLSIPSFDDGESFSSRVQIISSQECDGTSSYCSVLTLSLQNAGSFTDFPSLKFNVLPEKVIHLSVSPSVLVPGEEQLVRVLVLDPLNRPLKPLDGTMVVGQIKNEFGESIGSPIVFTSDYSGLFYSIVPDTISDGFVLSLVGSSPGYVPGLASIPVSGDFGFNFSQDFSCLSVSPLSQEMVLGGFGSVVLSTSDCPDSLRVYTQGFSENGYTFEIVSKLGSQFVTSSNPVVLNVNDSKTLTLLSPTYIGEYPLYVYAKYDYESVYSLAEKASVIVNPISPSSECLSIDSYSFDLTNGSDVAELTNRCNPFVHDPFMPSAGITLDSVYAHSISPVFTPSIRFPDNPVSFSWSVNVDYGFSSNVDVNHEDFTHSPSIGNGFWNYYEVVSPGVFLDEKSDFSVLPVLIPDTSSAHSFRLENNYPDSSSQEKAILFETTLISVRDTVLDRVCFGKSNLTGLSVRVNGLEWVRVEDSGSDNTYCLDDFLLKAGPNSIQIFIRNGSARDWFLKVYQSVGGNNRELSFDGGRGLFLSPEYGIPFSNDSFSNGKYSFGPFSSSVIPMNSKSPVKIGTLSGPVFDILSNVGGIDHLKRSFLRVNSDNPEVRVFVKDNDVWAQYVGFDDPSSFQYIALENTNLSGEKYGLLSLTDYTFPSPSSGNAIDLGVLLDASSSLLADELDSSDGKQNGFCRGIANLEKSVEYYSGANVNLKVFWMSTPSDEYTKRQSCDDGEPTLGCGSPIPPCSGILSVETLPPSIPSGITFDDSIHSLKESWAIGVEAVSNSSFWRNPIRGLIVVSDNKPLGLGEQALSSNWDSQEQTLVNRAVSSIVNKGIKGFVLYDTPLESTSILDFGNTEKNDSIELMDYFSSQSGGFLEAFDYSEFVNNTNPLVFEHSGNNKVGERLARSLFETSTKKIVVKVLGNPSNACVGENSQIGDTGLSVLPKIWMDWSWDSIDLDLCDRKSGVGQEGNFRFCDSTQFTVSLVKKLNELQKAYGPNATPYQIASIPQLLSFDSYLVRDAFSNDFRNDFVYFFTESSFADAPSYFKNELTGAWQSYIDPSFNSLLFEVENGSGGVSFNDTLLPQSGLYRVELDIDWESDVGLFFISSTPSSVIHVKLTPIASADGLSLNAPWYRIPFDGLVGFDEDSLEFSRIGYGTGFTGDVVEVVQTNSYTYYTYPMSSNSIPSISLKVRMDDDFVSANTIDPGQIINVSIDSSGNSGNVVFRPMIPSPVILDWKTNSVGFGDVYYSVQETSGSGTKFIAHSTSSENGLSFWEPFASVEKAPTFGCNSPSCSICLDGGGNVFGGKIVSDSNPNVFSDVTYCALRSPLTKNQAFGFTSNGSIKNDSYLGGVLYRPLSKNYSILLGCNDTSISNKEIGSILTGSAVLSNQGQTVSVLDMGNNSLEELFSESKSMEGSLNLIAQDWTCVSGGSDWVSLYWNKDRVLDSLISKYSSFGSIPGNNCVSTGNVLAGGNTYTLKERIASISSNTIIPFCPLYSDIPYLGYYAQFGLPYPIGTQVFTQTSSDSVNTTDLVNSIVQYRYFPSNCSVQGIPSGTRCSSSSGFTPNSYCSTDSERYWSLDRGNT